MFRRISLAAAVLLSGCGIRSEVSRAKYVGPIAKPLWKADDIMVDQVFIENGIVYCRARTFAEPSRHLYAFDSASGKRLWVSPFELDTGQSQFFVRDALVVRDKDKRAQIVDPKTGEALDRPALKTALRGITTGGVTYIVSMGRLTAFDAVSLKELWHTALVIGEITDGPIVAGGRVYVVGALLQAFDLKTGESRWTWKSKGYVSLITADQNAVYAYLSDQNVSAISLDAATGKQLWTQSLISVNAMESPVLMGSDELLIRDYPGGRSAPLSWTGYMFRTVKRATGAKVSEVTTTWKYSSWVIGDGQIYASDKSTAKLLNEAGDGPPDSWLGVASLQTGQELWRGETVHYGVFSRPATGSGMVAVGIEPYSAPVPKKGDPKPAGLWVWKTVQ